ncbi:hypothetical protein ACIRP7_13975 [Streptomyces sp. NPDC102270]|uniref:hypothetical protein n=1 Tax=Streptomyces sp. NPDC102270 TaxID=3366150 RepID=UPI00381D3218
MIVRFAGGPLAGRVLSTSAPWPGGWLKGDGADWALYLPTHRDPANGIVLAEVQETGRPMPVGSVVQGARVGGRDQDVTRQ